MAGAASAQERQTTIVARGQVDGARCVDMLIDTGASCCFIRRSCAERLRLQQTELKERVTVTLADKRTAVSTHEVRVKSMRVHGSEAACSLLVMDELSNDVIVGLNWQRATNLIIVPGHPHDLLNGQPVHRCVRQSTVGRRRVERGRTHTAVCCVAALLHAGAVPTEVGSDASQRLASLSVADVANSQLRQVLERHSRVFTEVLPAGRLPSR